MSIFEVPDEIWEDASPILQLAIECCVSGSGLKIDRVFLNVLPQEIQNHFSSYAGARINLPEFEQKCLSYLRFEQKHRVKSMEIPSEYHSEVKLPSRRSYPIRRIEPSSLFSFLRHSEILAEVSGEPRESWCKKLLIGMFKREFEEDRLAPSGTNYALTDLICLKPDFDLYNNEVKLKNFWTVDKILVNLGELAPRATPLGFLEELGLGNNSEFLRAALPFGHWAQWAKYVMSTDNKAAISALLSAIILRIESTETPIHFFGDVLRSL
jgi:hypothetical protein